MSLEQPILVYQSNPFNEAELAIFWFTSLFDIHCPQQFRAYLKLLT